MYNFVVFAENSGSLFGGTVAPTDEKKKVPPLGVQTHKDRIILFDYCADASVFLSKCFSDIFSICGLSLHKNSDKPCCTSVLECFSNILSIAESSCTAIWTRTDVRGAG